VFRADQLGGLQSFIGVRGRHPNIGYDDVRLMRTNVTHQAVSVARLAYDLEAGVLEHPGHSRAEQGRVICDDDAQWSIVASAVDHRRLDGCEDVVRGPYRIVVERAGVVRRLAGDLGTQCGALAVRAVNVEPAAKRLDPIGQAA
jgi:hypothetical protein